MPNIVTSKTRLYKDIKPPIGSVVNSSHPLSKGLVGCWLMNEGGGKTLIDLTNQNNGVIGTNLRTLTKLGSAIKFNASATDIITIPQNGSNTGGYTALTFVCRYLQLGSQPDSDFGIIIVKNVTGGSGQPAFSLFPTTSGYFRVRMNTSTNDSGANVWNTSAGVYSLNKIYQIVLTWKSGETPLLYVEKKLLGWASSAGTLSGTLVSTTGTLMFGSAGLRLNGVILDALLYKNRALSPSEIQSLYEAPYQMIQPQRRFSLISMGGETPTSPGISYSTARLWQYLY